MNVKGFGDQVLKKFEASTTGRMSVRVPGVALAKHREAQVLSASVWGGFMVYRCSRRAQLS